jgi:16S rRNA (cytosine1402-N4)-methyltransferase
LREQQSGHTSVLVEESLNLLDLKDGETVLDATLGQGGHSEAILREAKVKLIGLDADAQALTAAGERLTQFHSRVEFIEGNFRDMERLLSLKGIEKIDNILFDLGWSSVQLTAGRGFSFLSDEPLNMSYGSRPQSGFTAADILNMWSEKGIADALYGYGEERYAKRIARAVIERRKEAPIKSTIELVEIVKDSVPPTYRHGRIHPATKTFQALRIAVNDELTSLEMGLTSAWKLLAPGGRIVVITFHSIEDRIVKKLFASFAKKDGILLVKKPVTPSRSEITNNPRARSAKLRGIKKNR